MRLCSKKIFLGVPNDSAMNLVICIGKSLIAKQGHLNINQFALRLKIDVMNERRTAKNHRRLEYFEEVWGNINKALERL